MKYTKDFARYYVSYQDNLSESDKITLLNFVNEGSDFQITALLHLGKMYEQNEVFDMIIENPEIFNLNEIKTGAADTYSHKIIKGGIKVIKKWKDGTQHVRTYFTDVDNLTSRLKGGFKKFGIKPGDSKTVKMNKMNAYVKAKWGNMADVPAAAKSAMKKAIDNASGAETGIKPTLRGGSYADPAIAKKAGIKIGQLQGAGALVVAAVIAAGSYAIYKRFISKSARACSNKSGAEKTLCMQQYKKKATQARIKNMQSQLKQCDKTKDPAKCKAKTMQTIKHLQSKI